jgi:2-keto-3-deoxy-L-rhamnonate aldolase RhmA
VVALAGFDFAFLDGEHGRISPEDAYPMILAAEANGIPALARVGQNDRQVILKFLDLGISGVMIPQTNTEASARDAVQAMRYHPRGIRGLAGGRSFGYGMGGPAHELVPQINDRVLSIIQFEHIDALAELDALMAIPDLDILFVGPNDLAQSMGYPGQPGHAEVEAVIAQICERARGRIPLGTVAADANAVNKRIEQGFQMLVPNVAVLLASGSKSLLAGVRRP